MGPDEPIFHLLESLAIKDVYPFEDDFLGTLNTDNWTLANSGGDSVDFAVSTTLTGGVAEGDGGTSNDGYANMFSDIEAWSVDNRPLAITRLQPRTAITDSKFEFGFADAAAAGQALVKATPTSTGTDYAVIVRDTDDDTSVDMQRDGTTLAVQSIAGTHGVTWTLNAWHTFMIALNEQGESYFWANGSLGGVLRATATAGGPDNDTTLGLFLFTQVRTTSAHEVRCDYIKALGERVAL